MTLVNTVIGHHLSSVSSGRQGGGGDQLNLRLPHRQLSFDAGIWRLAACRHPAGLMLAFKRN
jgi:hypothetical protein